MKKAKRYGISAILLAGVGIGIYLNDMLPQLGSGVGIGAPTTSQNDAADETDIQSKDDDKETQLARPDVVEVMIDSRKYAIRLRSNGQESYQTVDLSQILDFAKAVPGTEDGIKVIIARKENSRATAEMELRDKLLETGIKDTAILWQKEFVQ